MGIELGFACFRRVRGLCADVLEIFFLIGGIHAQEVMLLGDFVHQDVIHEATVRIEQARVLRLAGFELAGVIAGDEVSEGAGFGTANFDFAHVADIEQTHGGTNGPVFLHNTGILNGHFPAAEIDQFGAQGLVYGMERCGAKGSCRSHQKLRLTYGSGAGLTTETRRHREKQNQIKNLRAQR